MSPVSTQGRFDALVHAGHTTVSADVAADWPVSPGPTQLSGGPEVMRTRAEMTARHVHIGEQSRQQRTMRSGWPNAFDFDNIIDDNPYIRSDEPPSPWNQALGNMGRDSHGQRPIEFRGLSQSQHEHKEHFEEDVDDDEH